MSHVATVDLEVRDLEALKLAANRLGLELVEGQKTYRWYGRSVGDYPMPAGFTADDLGKCEHAIRVPGDSRAYEIGVVRRKDGKPGYQLLWDFWCRGFGMQDRVGDGANKLRQEYAAAVSTRQAAKAGFRVQRVDMPDGRIVLKASR